MFLTLLKCVFLNILQNVVRSLLSAGCPNINGISNINDSAAGLKLNLFCLQNPPIKFEFEDLLPSEILRRTVTAATTEWNDPALRVIKPGNVYMSLFGLSDMLAV